MKPSPDMVPWHWQWDKAGKLVRTLYMRREDWERYCRGLPPRPHGAASAPLAPPPEPEKSRSRRGVQAQLL